MIQAASPPAFKPVQAPKFQGLARQMLESQWCRTGAVVGTGGAGLAALRGADEFIKPDMPGYGYVLIALLGTSAGCFVLERIKDTIKAQEKERKKMLKKGMKEIDKDPLAAMTPVEKDREFAKGKTRGRHGALVWLADSMGEAFKADVPKKTQKEIAKLVARLLLKSRKHNKDHIVPNITDPKFNPVPYLDRLEGKSLEEIKAILLPQDKKSKNFDITMGNQHGRYDDLYKVSSFIKEGLIDELPEDKQKEILTILAVAMEHSRDYHRSRKRS